MDDTIAAISTPLGEGAIAMLRMSGPRAVAIADEVFRAKTRAAELVPRVQQFGAIFDGERKLDDVLLTVFRAPHSYTGEDVVEIAGHGGVLVTRRILELLLKSGARSAEPGEFTQRAFLHGKMDLTQAEAVMDLITAQTDLALRAATEQLEGRLGQDIRSIRDELIALIAHVEASIDFPEEGIAPDSEDEAAARLGSISEKMSALLATADQGRILREGVRVVIYGSTNAGKSSLLNRLLGYDRVIVSETHGTTRDTIEEVINLGGVPMRLLDTAGLRISADDVEREGVARTEKSLQSADLRLHIADRNAPKPADFQGRSGNGKGAKIVILNKSDLPEHCDWKGVEALRISCLTGEGVSQLEKEILARITKENLRPESMVAINARHRDCLRRALESCNRARQALRQGTAPEYVAVDLKEALRALGEVIGAVDVEQILDSVFSQFCIGK